MADSATGPENEIQVESYQKVASIGGWSGASRTFWAISALGAACGAAIGLVAPFFPLIAGVSSAALAISAIPASVATFATIGIGTGFASGAMLGRMSGAAAAVAEEQEKRMKSWTVRQMRQQNPEIKIITDPPREKPPEKSFWQRMKDTYNTYFNPRVGTLFTVIGIVAGLIMAAAFLSTGIGGVMPTEALGALTGMGKDAFTATAIKAAPEAFIAYTAGVMGAFGSLFYFNFPKITSAVTEVTGNFLNGKLLGREWGPGPEKRVEPSPAIQSLPLAEEVRAAAPSASPTKSFTLEHTHFSLQAVLDKRDEPAPELRTR